MKKLVVLPTLSCYNRHCVDLDLSQTGSVILAAVAVAVPLTVTLVRCEAALLNMRLETCLSQDVQARPEWSCLVDNVRFQLSV